MSTSCEILADAQEYLEADRRRFLKGTWIRHRKHRAKVNAVTRASLVDARKYVREHPNANPQCCAEGAVLLAAARRGATQAEMKDALHRLRKASMALYKAGIVSVNDGKGRTRKAVLKAFQTARDNCS